MSRVLTSHQRDWLNLAIRQKGRFTTKRAVKQQMEVYLRRSDKIMEAMKALGETHPEYANLRNQMNDASAFARAGDLKSAYRSLENTKVMARAAVSGRAAEIQVNLLEAEIRSISHDMGTGKAAKDEAMAQFIDLHARLEQHPAVSEAEEEFTGALDWLRAFQAEESIIRGALTVADTALNAARDLLIQFRLSGRSEAVVRDLQVLIQTGNAGVAGPMLQRINDLVARREQDSMLNVPYGITAKGQAQVKAIEAQLTRIKSLAKWQVRDPGDAVVPDEKTAESRGQLTTDEEARKGLLEQEAARLKRAKDAIAAEYASDQQALSDTGIAAREMPPQPLTFNAATLNGLSGDAILGADIDAQQAQAVVTETTRKITEFLTSADSNKDEVFDLSIKTRSELMTMIAQETLGNPNADTWTESQQQMLQQAAEAAELALCASLPNSFSVDGQSVSVGGVVYANPVVLKAGANGVATLYKDADGNPIVIKTPLTDTDQKRDDAIREMQIHYRATKDAGEDSSLVGFQGVVRSPDGQMHMVLEAVGGGDLSDRGTAMSVATSAGLLPEPARQALAVKELLATAHALKEMEVKGLVHRDIKGLNVMMTTDGKVKIIDFGESVFVDDDTGKATEDTIREMTPDYASPELYAGKDHDTKTDSYAIGAMLRNMVATLNAGSDRSQARMQTGTLGRVVAALTDPEPQNRPSMDAVLQSVLATSYEAEFNEENVNDLQAASHEFTAQMLSVRGNIDTGALALKMSPDAAKELKPSMKAINLQAMIDTYEAKYSKLAQKPGTTLEQVSENEAALKALRKDIEAIRKDILKPMVGASVETSKAALQEDLENEDLTVEVDIGKGPLTVTVKRALALRDQIDAKITEVRNKAMLLLNGQEESESLGEKVDRLNAEMTRFDTIARTIEKTVYGTVRPEAKLFLANEKMQKAAAAFGPVTGG